MNFLKGLVVCVWVLLGSCTGNEDTLTGASVQVESQQEGLASTDGVPQLVDLYVPQNDYNPESTSDYMDFREDEGDFYADETNLYGEDASTSSDFDVSDTDADYEAPTDTSDEGDCPYHEP